MIAKRYSVSARGDTAEKALKFLNSIETDLQLFDLSWSGVKVWPLIRHSVFEDILKAIDVFRFRATPNIISQRRRSYFRRNPLLKFEKSKVMVFRWGRGTRLAGQPFDVYTDPLAAELESSGAEMIDLSPFAVDEGGPFSSCTSRAEPLASTWGRIAGRIWRSIGEPEQSTRVHLFEASRALSDEFSAPFSLIDKAKGAVSEYFRQFHLWQPVFAVRKPHLVILGIQSYGFEGLLAAARNAGATTAEIQHGLIYPGHLAYQFPNEDVISHKPDVLLTFGGWWDTAVKYPQNMRRYSIGFRALDNARIERRAIAHQEGIVLLSGDQFFGSDILAAIKTLRCRFPEHSIKIRSHPSDSFDYTSAIARSAFRGVSESDPRSQSLHEFLLRGDLAVGAASMAIAESTALGLPTVAVLGEMKSVIGPVLEAGGAVICENLTDLANTLVRAPVPPSQSVLFDESKDRLQSFLDTYA